MRRVLALAALLAFMPTANAQDKAKADYSVNAEYRARYFWINNVGADEDNGNQGFARSRFKIDGSFKANDKLGAHISLLNNINFGTEGGAANTVGGTSGGFDDLLTVNQMYANWMFSDSTNFRVGRMDFQIADGYVMGNNQWLENPYSFDGLLGNWDLDFGRLQAFAFKYRDQMTGTSASSDPEHNAYGLNFDMKTTPEWFKALNVHVIQDVQDAIAGDTDNTVQGLTGQDVLRYGVHGAFNFGLVDLKAWYAAQTGNYKQTGGATVTELDAKGTMMQAELGLNFENLMGSRFFVQYHVDSGDENTTDGEEGTYDPYFYEEHGNAGLMDLFQWGNLTYITLGWTGKVSDRTNVGAMYHMFSLTESGATTSGFTPGTRGGLTVADVTKDELGNEVDVWAEHMYDGGLSTVLRLGYFMPGDHFDSGATPAGDDIIEVMVEGKLTF